MTSMSLRINQNTHQIPQAKISFAGKGMRGIQQSENVLLDFAVTIEAL